MSTSEFVVRKVWGDYLLDEEAIYEELGVESPKEKLRRELKKLNENQNSR